MLNTNSVPSDQYIQLASYLKFTIFILRNMSIASLNSVFFIVFLLQWHQIRPILSTNTNITECIHRDVSLTFRCVDEVHDDLTPTIRSTNTSDFECNNHQILFNSINRLDIVLCDWSTLPDQLLRSFTNLTHLTLRMLSLERIESDDIPSMAQRDITQFHQITLDISNNKIHQIATGALQRLSTVTFMDLSHNRLQHLASATFSAGLAGLEVLDLGFNQIEDLPSDLFHGLSKLRKVVLVRNRIRTIGTSIFAQNNQLIVWNLARNRITDLLRDSFVHLHRLEYLDVSHSNVAFIESKAFTPLRNLKFLDLSHNRLTHIDFDVFACTSERLQTLLLSDNQLTRFSGHVKHFFPNLSMFGIEFNLFRCEYLWDFFATAPENVRRASKLYEALRMNETNQSPVRCISD